MRYKKYIAILIITIMIFSFSSCGNKDVTTETEENTATEAQAETEPQPTETETKLTSSGGEFDGAVILINRTYTLNPLLSNDETLCKALNLVYQNIVSYNEDNTLQLNLIENYVFNPANKSFDINIKQGMKWDDGQPIDADDFVYSYNTLLSAPANAYYKNVISNVASFTKTGEYSVRAVVKQAQTGNPYFLAFPAIPEHKKNDPTMIDDVHLTPVVGNGIYSNISNTVNSEIILKDNMSDNLDPSIDNVKLKIVNDNESIYYGFEQNISNVLASTVAQWSKYHVSKDVNIDSYSNMQMAVLGFNFGKEINNDINFRNCVYYSIPFEQINNSIYLGYCDTSRSLYPSNHFAYNDKIPKEEFDSIKADQYLKKTAYGGQTLKLITIANDNELQKVCEIIQDNLSIIKVNVQIVPLSLEDYKKALVSRDYDMYVGNFKMSVLPDFSRLVGLNNYSGYNNEALVTYQNGLNASVSYEEYKNIALVVQNIVSTEKPVIPIVHNHDAIFSNAEFTTVKPTSYNTPYQNMDKWVKE